MTNYIFPSTDKPLYGLTTGTAYEPVSDLLWKAGIEFFNLNTLARSEPDGVTDVRPIKTGDTINAEEHLSTLPHGTILRAMYNGEAWQKVDDFCFYRVGAVKEYNAASVSLRGAFTVLWMPEGEQA